jgi:predicted proteasome-type protease
MNRQEILQLKVMSLQAAAGNLAQGQAIYHWLKEKTDDDGNPAAAKVQALALVTDTPATDA